MESGERITEVWLLCSVRPATCRASVFKVIELRIFFPIS